MKSTSTTTTISTATQILVEATATTLGAETARRNNQVAGAEDAEIPAGSTIPNIAAALRMGTEVQLIGLVVQPAETPCPIARRMPGNRLAGRAEIWPAIGPEEPA